MFGVCFHKSSLYKWREAYWKQNQVFMGVISLDRSGRPQPLHSIIHKLICCCSLTSYDITCYQECTMFTLFHSLSNFHVISQIWSPQQFLYDRGPCQFMLHGNRLVTYDATSKYVLLQSYKIWSPLLLTVGSIFYTQNLYTKWLFCLAVYFLSGII